MTFSKIMIPVMKFLSKLSLSDIINPIICLVTLLENLLLLIIVFLLKLLFFHAFIKFICSKYLSQFGKCRNSFFVLKQLDFYRLQLNIMYLLINFLLELFGIFVFDLTMFEHFIHKAALVYQEVILSSSMLD